MKILLIGGGGREHALAWKLAQSSKVESILAAPGNPGIAELPKCECISLSLDDLEKVADFAEDNCIDLTVVGPEATCCRYRRCFQTSWLACIWSIQGSCSIGRLQSIL